MIIYIRHADDEYPDATHRYDHRITVRGAKRARKLARFLVRQYGVPSMIYRTPFVRGRETVDAMRPELPNDPEVYIDRRLSRRFSKVEQADPSIFSETHEHRPPIKEDRAGFASRVSKHYHAMVNAGHVDSTAVVWCITHAIVYKVLAARFGVSVPDHISFLDFFPTPSHASPRVQNAQEVRQEPPREEHRVETRHAHPRQEGQLRQGARPHQDKRRDCGRDKREERDGKCEDRHVRKNKGHWHRKDRLGDREQGQNRKERDHDWQAQDRNHRERDYNYQDRDRDRKERDRGCRDRKEREINRDCRRDRGHRHPKLRRGLPRDGQW